MWKNSGVGAVWFLSGGFPHVFSGLEGMMQVRTVVLSWAMLGVGCGGAPPVVATPLVGVVGGLEWTGRGGVAFTSRAEGDASGKWIDVADGLASLGCSNFPVSTQLVGTIPWTEGAFDLSAGRTLSFVLSVPDGGTSTLVATTGRVELSDVTDAGARLRVRAQFDAESSVEGEVSLHVCD
jgi:hypothetical protein